MLKLRYLVIKGIENVIPYIKDDFNSKTLELLSLPYDEVYSKIQQEKLTYLSAIGILDADNSRFLYDYLITLNKEQFDTETLNLVNARIIYQTNAPILNMIRKATAKMLLANRDYRFQVMERNIIKYGVIIHVAVEDVEFAKSLGLDEIRTDDYLENIDFSIDEEADVYLENSGIMFDYLLFLGLITSVNLYKKGKEEAIAAVTRYVKKLIAKGYSCNQMMGEMANDNDYATHYEIEAEGIILACPENDWSWLPGYFRKIDNEVLEDFWNTRQDV